jgi:NagD protein
VGFNFDPYDAVLLDLDGTIYHEDHPLPGALDLIRRLQREGRNYACLSNSTSSPQRVSARLQRMGVDVEPRRIYTAGQAAVDYALEKYAPRARIFNLATEGVRLMLQDRAVDVEIADRACDAIIIGAPANVFAGPDRQRTALVLARNGAELVGVCADRIYPSLRGLEFGSGALSLMLGYAANRPVTYVGKPQAIFFQRLCQQINTEPSGCVLIGDNIESDVLGARNVGMKTVLTLTGVTHRGELDRLPAENWPDSVIESLTDLL